MKTFEEMEDVGLGWLTECNFALIQLVRLDVVCGDRCDDGQMSPSNLRLQPRCAILTRQKSNTFLVF